MAQALEDWNHRGLDPLASDYDSDMSTWLVMRITNAPAPKLSLAAFLITSVIFSSSVHLGIKAQIIRKEILYQFNITKYNKQFPDN